MTIYFKDGVETGNFTKWTGTTGANMTVVTTNPYLGSYNINAHLASGAAAGSWARAYYGALGLAAPAHIFWRVMNFSDTNVPGTNNHAIRFMNITNTTSGTQIAAAIHGRTGGNQRFGLYTRHLAALTTAFNTTPFVTNTNYCVELEVQQSTAGNADGFVKLYVDRVLIQTVSGLDNDDVTVEYVHVGAQCSNATASTYDTTFDCCQANSLYNSCIVKKMNLPQDWKFNEGFIKSFRPRLVIPSSNDPNQSFRD